MAVYTRVNDEELADFLAAYGEAKLITFKGIAEGVENSNYFVRTTEADLILTLFEKRVDREDLPFFLGLLEHLAAKGLPVAQPQVSLAGEVLGELAGRPATLVTFLPGVAIARPDQTHAAVLGKELARLHLAGADYGLRRANALGPGGWRVLIGRIGKNGENWHGGIAAEIAEEFALLRDAWPQKLPSGIIHADLFPDNVLFQGHEIKGLIDFYFACNDLLAYDLAVSLNAWCFDENSAFEPEKAEAMLAGYQSVRPLEGAEKASLTLLSRGAALRFFLTRLFDWINHDHNALVNAHDPMPFLLRSRFFRTAEAKSFFERLWV